MKRLLDFRRRDREAATVVLGVAVHSGAVAATRLRVLQYRPALAKQGIELRLWSFLDERDEHAWLGKNVLRKCWLVLKGMARLFSLVRSSRGALIIVVQQEALPLGPPILESFLRRHRKMIWDIDDAVWEHHTSVRWLPRWFRASGQKYRRLCAMADEIWAGSEVLASWCRRHNPNVQLLPTVVDVPNERPEHGGSRSAGWIGSPTTTPFIEAVLPAVAAVVDPPEVLVVGGNPLIPDGLEAKVQGWSPKAEEVALRHLRVGLYPVDRSHVLAEGKCGLKAVLYMSRGIPPIVTPTTTNAVIVRDGQDGLHAETAADWTSSIQRLLDDAQFWEKLSVSAWSRAWEYYSVSAWEGFVVRRLRTLSDEQAAGLRLPTHS